MVVGGFGLSNLITRWLMAMFIVLAWGVRFEYLGVDAGYGKGPGFLRTLDASATHFVADVQGDQPIYSHPQWVEVLSGDEIPPIPFCKGGSRVNGSDLGWC